MRLGVHLVNFDFPGGPGSIRRVLTDVAVTAESVGIDNLSCMDHWFQLEFMGSAGSPMLEGYTTLSFLAAHTTTVELQLLVTGVTYRHPGLLAKQVATLDVLSGGRAVLGLGAAWYEREHRGLGVPFPPLAERFERLEETLQVVRQMYSDNNGPYEGKHYRLEETLCSPQPLRRVPVMVGGSGEKKSLRLVAKYADACNLFANPALGPETVALKLDVLRAHCFEVGRDFDEIRKTVLWSSPFDPVGDAKSLLGHLAELADLGITEVHVMPFGTDPVGFLRALGDHVVPHLARH
jgi:F420-dependent oxidoreductase-like protein